MYELWERKENLKMLKLLLEEKPKTLVAQVYELNTLAFS